VALGWYGGIARKHARFRFYGPLRTWLRSMIAESYVEFTIPDYFNVEWVDHFLCRVPAMLFERSVFPLLSISALEVSDVHPNSQSSSVRGERRMVLR
jgi:hypothetical protein